MKAFWKVLSAILRLLLAVVWLFPFYIMVVNSFKTKADLFKDTLGFPKHFIFDNYVKAAERLELTVSLKNSVIVLVLSLVILLLFTSMASYALERNKKRVSTVIFLVFASALLVPFQSIMIPLINLFGMAQLLKVWGLVFMYLGFGSSMAIFLYHGALKSIPVSLDEAAYIDGCGRFKIFWLIIFPNLKNITVTVAVLDTIWIWNDYLLPSLVINKKETMTIPLKVFYFFGEYTKQWNLAMAGLVIAIVPVMLFYFAAQKQIISGITSGAVKQ
ncbi:MAG: carbohydrate ABC transporter permease [Clostridia bacterium]|nr:carbohydrate ABC transporter permease [Clostridia bacterium]